MPYQLSLYLDSSPVRANEDFTEEETVFEINKIGDDAEDIVQGLRLEWKKHMQTIEQKMRTEMTSIIFIFIVKK